MQLNTHKAPHIRSRETNRTLMLDAVVALFPLYAMAIYFYGFRALVLGLVSVVTAVLFDALSVVLSGKIPNVRDISAIVTGLIIPLLLPATISYQTIIIAVAFAIFVAKLPFGGVGQNIFNPSVAGVAFITITAGAEVFSYPLPFSDIAILGESTAQIANSPLHALNLGGIPSYELMNIILGNVPSAMGAGHILVLASALLFLLMRGHIHLYSVLSFMLGFGSVAAIFPRITASPLLSIVYELCSGFAMIALVILLSDPVTSPKRKIGKIVYYFLAGILFMLFRILGRHEETILFTILIMNSSVWLIDYIAERAMHYYRRKNRVRE